MTTREQQAEASTMPTDEAANAPYCGNCGYALTGATDTSKCPECGLPLVDVLLRRGAPVLRGTRYRSDATLFGMPLLAVAFGQADDGPRGHAKGFIAVGDVATGVIAVGGFARGGVCVGGFSLGLVSIGGVSVGLLTALGGLAAGGVALGGGALGVVAVSGAAAGVIAHGGAVVGWAAQGGAAYGVHTITFKGASDATATQIFTSLQWFLGPAGTVGRPVAWIVGLDLAMVVLVLLVAWLAAGRGAFGGAIAGLRAARLPGSRTRA